MDPHQGEIAAWITRLLVGVLLTHVEPDRPRPQSPTYHCFRKFIIICRSPIMS